MADLYDREDIRRAIGEVTLWELNGGRGATADSAAAGSLTDAELYSTVRDQHVRKRSVVALTSGARRGDRRYAEGPPNTSGVVTVSPDFGGAPGTPAYEIWTPDGPHPDDLDAMIDKALREDCWYWRPTPLTQLPGGDVGDELAVVTTNIWETAQGAGTRMLFSPTNATLTLQHLLVPDEFMRRVIRVAATADGGYAEHQVPFEIGHDTTKAESDLTWHLSAIMSARPASGSGAPAGQAEIVIRDLTNSQNITPDYPLTWNRRGFGLVESSFTLPATCQRFTVRLTVSVNTELGEFGAIQLWNTNDTQFSLPRRVATKKHVGQVYERYGTLLGQFRPRALPAIVERRDASGRGVSLVLEPSPSTRSVYFYEKTPFPALTGRPPVATDDDNQTWAALPWVREAAIWECYKLLKRRDERDDPTRWLDALRDAEVALRARQSEYGAEPMLVFDSKRPVGPAVTKV